MILGNFTKQPADTLDYDIDFTEFFTDGDVIVTSGDPPVPAPLSVAVSPVGLTIGPTYVVGGIVVKQWLSGGVSGVKYKVTVTVTSNGGRVKQVEFVVRVKDI